MSSESESSVESEKELIIRKKAANIVPPKDSSSKLTTKEMVNQALTELNSKKGTSMYAIKKFLQENYDVNLDKMTPFIKKYVKASVAEGTIIQTKGTGATGSFRLNMQKNGKKKVDSKEAKQKSGKPEKVEKEKSAVIQKKIVKVAKDPKKKPLDIKKRKSIGSIIKPPKMKPAKVK